MNDKVIIEYCVAAKTELGKLEIVIRNYIEAGFQPFGGPFATDRLYCQALVKYKEKETIQ